MKLKDFVKCIPNNASINLSNLNFEVLFCGIRSDFPEKFFEREVFQFFAVSDCVHFVVV